MATREENLQKINEELETMSDEELENVAGGHCYQIYNDAKFLSEYGFSEQYSYFHLLFHPEHCREIAKNWSKAGVTVEYVEVFSNVYKIGEKTVTRQEACDYVKEKYGNK